MASGQRQDSVACYLPSVRSASPTSAIPRRMSSRIVFDVQQIQAYLAHDQSETALSGLLQASWAVILHYYTGMDQVCFAYDEIDLAGASSKTGSFLSKAQIHDGMILKDVVQQYTGEQSKFRFPSDTNPQNRSTNFHYNSSVMLHQRSSPSNPAVSATSQAAMALPEWCKIRILAKHINNSLSIFLEWRHPDVSRSFAGNISGLLSRVLHCMTSSPETAVQSLSHITDNDKQQILKWNASPSVTVERCIHEVIEEQVNAHPEKEAVCAWDGSFSYSELDQLATKLALHLVTLGIRPESRVVLCMDKSKWNIVAMLAVLKAGGAFVPLDPTHPIARIQNLTQAVESKVMICSPEHASRLSPTVETVVALDGDQLDALVVDNAEGLSSPVNGTNAAYVIFTSGSTGEPKGTVIEHQAFCSGAHVHGPAMLIDSESRVLQFAAHTFDASLTETLTPLMHGASVCIPNEESRLNGITAAINDLHVNHAFLTPSFIKFIEPAEVPGLKSLVLAGEALTQTNIETWSNIRLVNGYGPSESSVAAVVNANISRTTSCQDIGFPVCVKGWVVDPEDHNILLPIGCTGELLLEGPSLARCYLNNAEKTTQSFIFNPTWIESNGSNKEKRRFYKTGDLVRYNSDAGSFDFVGRKDTQVKFHGQRIELGEIETHVIRHSAVKHGLVLLPKSGPVAQKLVAVVSLDDSLLGHVPAAPVPLKMLENVSYEEHISTVRNMLKEILPTYMVPSIWLCIETFPMLASRKLDRRATFRWLETLPEESINKFIPASEPHESTTEDMTDLESKLQQVWSRVLNIPLPRTSLNHSFLSLGGDSITAMTCMNQCKKLGLGLSVQEILRCNSIRELAGCVKLVEARKVYHEDVEETFSLSPIQKLHFDVRSDDQGHFNQSFFLRLNRQITENKLKDAITAIVTRHSMLRARFSYNGAQQRWEQRITRHNDESCRFSSYEISTQEEAVNVIAKSQASLNAVTGPVISVDLFRLKDGGQLLSLIGHHLVVDLVSWRVILEDLEELLLHSPSPSLSEPTMPFQTWTRLQQSRVDNGVTKQNLDTNDVPVCDLSYWGMSSKANTYGDVACEGFELDIPTTSLIMADSNTALRTEVVDILVAALLHSFGRTFPDHALPVIYNEGHGREAWDQSIDISRTIGWFTIIYPIFVQAAALNDAVETVIQVKDRRKQVNDNGREYFANCILTDIGADKYRPMEISFNYLGRYQQLERSGALFQPIQGLAGETSQGGGAADFGSKTPRFGLFEISAVVVQDAMRFTFSFNGSMKHQQRIREWISLCHSTINQLSSALISLQPRATITDFPLLSLTDDDVSRLNTEKLPALGIKSFDEVEDIYSCSPMQQGLLLSTSRDLSFYAVRGTYEVKATRGNVDVQQLAHSWQQVVNRHAALRTLFVEHLSTNDLYSQIVLRHYVASPQIFRCSSETDVETVLDSHLMKLSIEKPLHQFTICVTDSDRVFCRLELSHAIMDGASISLILRDLEQAYSGHGSSSTKPLFKNFISYLQSVNMGNMIDYWKSYLSGVEPCHVPLLNDGYGSERKYSSLRLDFPDFGLLQSTCEKYKLTVANAIHGAWALTLRCYTGSDEVCFGYLLSERDAPIDKADEIVGPLINMLACRVSMPADCVLSQLLEGIQKDYMNSLPFKHCSLADIQHELGLSGTALFNTCLSYRKLLPEPDRAPSIRFAESAGLHDPTEYLVTINVEASDKEAVIDLDYWTNLLSHGQADNMAKTFIKALENIIEYPERTLGELNFVSPSSLDKILEWNNSMPETIPKCIHEVFQEQVKLSPNKPAICSWDGNLTYSEVDVLSSRLAYYLSDLGVEPETYVALCFDKSAYAIVSMIAVLKAGGGCVPLDAGHPKAALDLRVLESGANIVLSSPSRTYLLEDIVPYAIPVDATLFDELEDSSAGDLNSAHPENVAFLIFTSGSTGQPKGVVLEHRTLVTSAAAHGAALGVDATTRFLQFASYSFDNSLEEIFTTLMRGGCVCVPSEEDRMNNLAKAMNDLDVNFTDMTATVASFLQPSDVPKLKGLAIGGEAPTQEIKDTWTKVLRLQNIYGPTECSINCCHNADVGRLSDVTNIGRGIGCVTWVVNPSDHNSLVPVGCVGELLIEGPILARHYLNNPKKTQDAFIENPRFIETCVGTVGTAHNSETLTQTKHRMYKTGDLVRYNSDGSLVYLGRKDTQVKLNGQRIELGEIEHRMQATLPEDSQCSVDLIITRNGDTTSKFLVAFVCLQGGERVQAQTDIDFILPMTGAFQRLVTATKSTLMSQLQSYMVPNVYIPVSFFPMTSSGKLNRRLLRVTAEEIFTKDSSSYRLGGRTGRPPSTTAEKALQGLWASILSADPQNISADDTFFRHGGDSITAMKLVTAARKEGYIVTVADVFKYPTLSEMAQNISGLSRADAAERNEHIAPFSMVKKDISLVDLKAELSSTCGIATEDIEDIYPCTALQEGLIALSNTQPSSYVTQNIYKLDSDIDIARFKAAWQMVAQSEAILRTRIVHSKLCGFLQVVVREPMVWDSFDSVDSLSLQTRSLPAQNGGRLSRYSIIGQFTKEPLFVWTAHHAIYDGWSMPLLLDKIKAEYEGKAQGSKHARNSYNQFIKYLTSVGIEETQRFWTENLDGSPSTQFPPLPNSSYKASPGDRLNRNISLPRRASSDITLPSLVRASWAMVSSVFSFSEDVIFGEILTGRDAPVPGISDIIGPVLSIVPMRLQIDKSLSITQFLQEIQKQSASLIPYQFAGLHNIQRFSEDAKQACNFQTLFSIAHGDSDDINGIMSLLGANTGETNFYTYPLNVSCFIWENELEIQVHYDKGVLPEKQLERILIQFETMISNLCSQDNATVKVGEFELVGQQDLATISTWNAALSLSHNKKCIHDMIAESARLQPTAPAISSWDGSLTYRELDDYSNDLARHISTIVDKRSQQFIPICFEKSAFCIVSMLAIMKAGCAFVPLDPQYPAARHREIVSDTGAKVILCSPQYTALCQEVVGQVIAIDATAIRKLPKHGASLGKIDPKAAAYVIFTSGSTGKPKGCVIEHAAFCSGAIKKGPEFSFGRFSRVLQFASYTFDASLFEIFPVLVLGGCVCVPHDSTRLNGISQYINDSQVNTAVLTPSMAKTIQPQDVPSLQNLALVGEAMAPSHLATWAGKVRLINGYGPSETSIVAAVKPRMTPSTHPSNIGTPVGNAWLVDPDNHDRLVPVGAIGELLIEGPTLARGYLNNEEKTKQVFITQPRFTRKVPAPSNGERRMYKTGDLVKYAPDDSGELLYVGRKDNQAKVHGQRLELEEIEHHLSSDAEVMNATVIIPKSGKFEKKLVAVLSFRSLPGSVSDGNTLRLVENRLSGKMVPSVRERLGSKVPAYMIPSNWIVLERLPLLPSGKLNRRMVNQYVENVEDETYNNIVSAAEENSQGKVVVITETEAALQQIWASVLNLSVDSISLERSFIHSGGDSMSAMAVMSQCRSQNLGVTVENIITCKSIRHLASLVKLPQREIFEEESYTEFDLSPIQSFYFRCMQGQTHHFNQSTMVEIKGSFSTDQLQQCINKIVDAHPMLRARFSRDGNGVWKQRISATVEGSYSFRTVEYYDSDDLPNEVEDAQKSLDIVNGPVMCVVLFESPPSNPLLLICAHHLVVDVVSWGIIVQDLENLLQGRLSTWSEGISFQRWCRMQAEHAKRTSNTKPLPLDDVPAADVAFWGMENTNNIHGDVVCEEFTVDPSRTERILGLTNEILQVELVDLLLGSLLFSFCRVFPNRKTPPCIYNEGHGREPHDSTVDLSQTVGWFTTMSPIHLPSNAGLGDGVSFRDYISWVKDLRRKIPGKGLPYFAQRFLTWEGSERYRDHWPMEITFNYLGKHNTSKTHDKLLEPVNGTGLSVNSSYDVGTDTPRFSLIEISAVIVDKSLSLSFSYNKFMKRQTGMNRWATDCKQLLIDTLNDPALQVRQPSLSDFSLLPLSFHGLKKLEESLQKSGIDSFEDIEDVYPSSPMQQGILLSQIKDSSTYSYKAVFEVGSTVGNNVDAQKLASAWINVVQRHATLRTVFIDGSHESSLMDQVVLKRPDTKVVLLHSSDADGLQSLSELHDLDFRDGSPPHRLSICHTSSGKIVCRFDISNAIADGTSMPIILRDLSREYMGLAPVTSQPPRYSDFIAHLQTVTKEKGVNYWKRYLSGSEPCLFPSTVEEQREKSLGSEILLLQSNARMQEFCKDNGITMSALFQLVWAMVLRAYTGMDEVCFGYVASGRDIPVDNIQDAVGAFINMLVYKINLKADMPLQKALKKTQLDFIKSMEHQSVSLAEVQHELGLADASLFNTAFTFQRRGGLEEDATPSLSFKVFGSHDPSEYKLAINVEMLDSSTEVHFTYWNDFLSAYHAKNIADTFRNIINEITSDSSTTRLIGDIDCFGELSCDAVRRWNNLSLEKVDKCVHEMIEEQASSQHPSAQAVDAWDAKLTYQELNNLACRLAKQLQNHGVGPEVIVPLFFEKSAWAIVAQVAVLKAGGAFVSFDPSHPEERLRALVDDVHGRVILSSAQQYDKVSKIFGTVIQVDRKSLQQVTWSNGQLRSLAKPTNTAYLIFTSGSTGKPKGTVIEHGQFCTGAVAHGKALHINSKTRSYQFASYTFDASILDILSVLVLGGCVCVPSNEERMNDMAGSIGRLRANWMCITPSVAGTLKPETIPTMKVIAMGGEKLTPGSIEKWSKSVCLVEAYGPTECSVVCATSEKVDSYGNILNFDPAVIGKTVGSRSWIVDQRDYNKLVPVGAIGELVIEGNIVGRGYLNNEKKTMEAFIQHPTWAANKNIRDLVSPGSRMYRTGDLVRYNSDGTLTYMARMDMQIKLNGQRIELGEIEYQCAQQMPDGVQLAVDLITPGAHAGAKKLAMFFTPSSAETSSANIAQNNERLLLPMSSSVQDMIKGLEKSLARSLPSYMIPQLFFPVMIIPFTTSGKLDRRKLYGEIKDLSRDDIKGYSLATSTKRQAPTDKTQLSLQTLWSEVLGLPAASIGSEDSFFRLGGDSLAAMKLVGIARSRGLGLSVLDVFRHPSLREMSSKCQTANVAPVNSVKPFSLLPHALREEILKEVTTQCSVSQDAVSDVYPCSPLQEGLITSSVQQKGAYVAKNILRLNDNVDISKFKTTWQQLVDEFDILRTRIVHTASSNFLQVVLKKHDIQWCMEQDIEEATSQSSNIPETNGGILTRYTLVEDKSSSSIYFVWLIHHALYDAWGLNIVLERFEEIYFSNSRFSPKPSYASFIHYLQGWDMKASDDFWKKYLANISCTPFPPLAEDMSENKKSLTKTVSTVTTMPHKQSELGLTTPVLIRAAWGLVLSSRMHSSDVCFGETLSGRNTDVTGITDLAGPVLTTVPTRIKIDSSLPKRKYLEEIQKLSADIISHQHAGIQHIRKLGADTASACDFKNLIVIQNGESADHNGLWEVQTDGTLGSFFTYPLVVECKLSSTHVELNFHYDEQVLSTWEAERIMFQLSHVLQQLASVNSSDTTSIETVEMISPEDSEEITWWNRRRPQAVDQCIHETFQEWCKSQPQASAVDGWDGRLSYQEMNTYASRLASYLRTFHVGPEVLVPLCLDRSTWTVVAMFAVLMAGGAIVPLDPTHPVERHTEIIRQLDASIVLCSPKYHSQFKGVVRNIVDIHEDTIKKLPYDTASITQSIGANCRNAAYGIFTSGSTGKPKGIIVEHRAFNSSSAAYSPAIRMNSDSRVLQFSSLAFDAALLEIFSTLTNGGCVCVPNDEERLHDISGAISRMNVNWTLLTPSVANLVDPLSVPSLRTLACGGEAMSPEVISKWTGKVELVNAYGPTETSVIGVTRSVAPNDSAKNIGYGTQSTLTWIVNPSDYNQLTPLGAVGELAMEGPSLSRGYLADEAKTKAVFVDDPSWASKFSLSVPGARRLHLSGDLVKYASDGSLIFVGRKDNQVKLNGQRMDLGEIEHRLGVDHRVRHVIVLLPKSGVLQKRLVAVLSLNASKQTTVSSQACELVKKSSLVDSELEDIKHNLSLQLPPYMVPQTWAVVNSIPMQVSGKLDRKKVQGWVEDIPEEACQHILGAEESTEAPTEVTGVTALLRDVWSQVLNIPVEKVKLNQSFMSLGGDSITAMAVVSRSRRLKIGLSLHDVLRCTSLIQLASKVEASIVTVQTEEKTEQDFELSPIQTMYFATSKEHTGNSRFNQSFSLRLSRYISPQAMRSAVRSLVIQHSMLRARFRQDGDGKWMQHLSSDIESSFMFSHYNIRQLSDATEAVTKSQCSLDISKGPLFSADMFETRDNQQFLFLVAHHLVVDMVSWRILIQDLQELIETGSLPTDKPLSFQSWCSLQSEHVRRHEKSKVRSFKILPANVGYWGMESTPNTYGHVEQKSFTLSEETTALTMTNHHDVFRTEPMDFLLTAIIHSFHCVFSDRFLPTLFNEGHGREPWDSQSDPSRTVGWFTNISPLQVTLQSDDILETLKRVKDARRSTQEITKHYLAYHFLSQSRQVPPTRSRFPMEILFNYLGAMQQLERDDSLLQSGEILSDAADPLEVGDMGPDTPRFALFDVAAIVMHGRLKFTFMYNRQMQHLDRIEQWISECQWALEELVVRLRRCSAEPTLSDYPLLPITYDGLKRLAKDTLPRLGISHRDQVEDIYPCSPTQEGMLLSQLRDPSTYLFNIIFEVTDPNPRRQVNPQQLTKAWNSVVDRHAALRTIFINSAYKGGAFDQVVLKSVESGITYFECDDDKVLTKLQSVQLSEKNGKRKQKIPHQLTVCKTNNGRVFIKMEINHAVIDGGSTQILIRDLALGYKEQLPEGRGPLYSEYIKFIRSQSAAEDISFWKRYLTGVQACHFPRLGTSYGNTGKGLASLTVQFDHWPELQQYCEKSAVTLANVIQAAWALVLQRYTGSDDVCFGYLSAGRDAPVNGIQDTIGVFINMLCCRVRLSGSQLLAEIPSIIQDDYMNGVPHQRCSLAQVQHELGLQGKQIFNTALSIQNHSKSSDSQDSSLIFTAQEAHDPSEYPITLNIETAKDEEGIVIRYWTDMISNDKATEISEAIASNLQAFVQDPTETVSRVKLRDLKPKRSDSDTKEKKASKPNTFQIDEIDHLLERHPGLQALIDERVQTIVQQMFSLSRRSSLTRKMSVRSNVTQRESMRVPQSESDAFSYASEDIYSPDVETPLVPVAAQIHERGRQATLEEKLLRLWSEKLDLPLSSITKDDSFFELGGDSITAMGLVGDARDEGLVLTVADVFRNPIFKDMASVAQIASEVSYVDVEINNMNRLGQQTSSISAKGNIYERFALLKSANIDEAFLQKYICPRVGVFKGGIVDILPVTDFQALSITGALLQSRWMLNFFCLDGRGALDFRRLKQSCFRVVHAFDILRTVFVASKGRFLQVILRKVRPEFSVFETDESLDEFTATLQQRDIEQGVKQGEPFVQFFIVKQKNTDRHRIILRLSHAQYDGVSLPKILSAIKAGYEGGPIPSPVSFANFVRDSARIITTGHYDHWRNLLQGSKMTYIVRRQAPGYRKSTGNTTILRKTVHVPSMAHGNITTATVIKAAWALTLARITGSDDVVFGHTISGRNTTAIAGVESMVGPCMNIVPVRVRFSERWTVLDLLRHVQDQQVGNMPYEALGFRQIVRECTDWPNWTTFSTILQHDVAGSSNEIKLGDNTYELKAFGSDEELADFSINSRSLDQNQVELVLSFSVGGSITMSLAQRVLDMVCDTAEGFTKKPDMALPSPSALSALPSYNANEEPIESNAISYRDQLSTSASQLAQLSRAEILVLSDVIRRAWEQVLADKDDNSPPLKPDSSFFELGGDLIGLAQVAWLLEQEDFRVQLDDLVECPTMMKQMGALVEPNNVEAQKLTSIMMAGSPSTANNSSSEIDAVGAGDPTLTQQSAAGKAGQRKAVNWASALGLAKKIVKRKAEVTEA